MKRILLLLGAALLSACSATQMVYNRLDWFASWQIGKYVELEGPSEALFESGFESLWQWHRGTQLPLYATDLRELADTAGAKLSAQQLNDFLKRANDHAARVLREGLPGAVQVFRAMDDAQVAGLLKRLAGARAERLEEDAERGLADQQERATRNLHKSLKRWLGSLSPEQKQRAQAWIESRPDDPALWQRYGDQWWAQFATILAARTQPDFDARLRELLLEPKLPDSAAVERLQLANNESSLALMSELSGTLSAEQREHFQAELRGLAQDLEVLAAQKV